MMVRDAVVHGSPGAAKPGRAGEVRMMTSGYFIFVTTCYCVFLFLRRWNQALFRATQCRCCCLSNLQVPP